VDADNAAITLLHGSFEHLTFQVYVGRTPLKYAEPYLNFLQRIQHPFKVGRLYQHPDIQGVQRLQHNPNYLGYLQ